MTRRLLGVSLNHAASRRQVAGSNQPDPVLIAGLVASCWFVPHASAGVVTYNDLAELNDQMLQVNIGILDFSKAFDVIPHTRLLNKLKFYDLSEEVISWIREFLQVRKQKVIHQRG